MDWETRELLERAAHELKSTREELRRVEGELVNVACIFGNIVAGLRSQPSLATSITFTFQGDSMNPTEAGQTQVFTGTLSPAGSVLAPDAVAKIESNDPAVSPTLDSTQLIVSVTYPTGWVESITTPLVFSYTTSSATTSQALSETITPSAPPPPTPVLATGIGFAQTQ